MDAAEAQGHRKAGAAGDGPQEPVAEAPGAEKQTVGGRRARTPGTRATAARGSQEQDAASGAPRKPGARTAETEELRMSGATAAEAGEAREPGATSAADGAAGKPGGADGESDKASDPESDNLSDPESQAEVVVRDAISAPDVDGRPRRATRRFPLFTRDTARPEGGGRAAPRDAPAPARQWPVLAVLATVGLGLLLTALDQFRYGTLLIGLALLAGAVLRWLLPDVGMLAVRSRFTDIATYGVLGTAIVLLAMMVQPNPWLVIPFLKDTLHFTVSSS
ncbi:hypothetical protein QF027_005997 [Streptomyces canus]|nr:hypothetical protein [Streptomyces canus]